MEFQPITQEQIQSRQIEFRTILRTVFGWGKKCNLSMEAIAGPSKSQLSRVLDLKHPDPYVTPVPRPDEQNLSHWCYVWYSHGIINIQQVEYIMNLAGHASPFQQHRASQATTEHHIVAIKPKRVNTEDLPPLPAGR